MASTNLIIAIVGPTASGKSSMAMRIAGEFGGEIICADSRTIYRGISIGIAKPTIDDRQKVVHHGLDLVYPSEQYTAPQFKSVAKNAIKTINSKGKTPLIVGGSGLYVDSVLYDYDFPKTEPDIYRDMSLEELRHVAKQKNLNPSEQTFNNKRHLHSYLSREGKGGKSPKPSNCLILGVSVEKEELNKRIELRVEQMFSEGLIVEARNVLEKWGESSPGLQACGYNHLFRFIKGHEDLSVTKERFATSHKQLAKRQMTWFKRNKDIQWVDSYEVAEQIIKANR